jgi:hypothetical protein
VEPRWVEVLTVPQEKNGIPLNAVDERRTYRRRA